MHIQSLENVAAKNRFVCRTYALLHDVRRLAQHMLGKYFFSNDCLVRLSAHRLTCTQNASNSLKSNEMCEDRYIGIGFVLLNYK